MTVAIVPRYRRTPALHGTVIAPAARRYRCARSREGLLQSRPGDRHDVQTADALGAPAVPFLAVDARPGLTLAGLDYRANVHSDRTAQMSADRMGFVPDKKETAGHYSDGFNSRRFTGPNAISR